MIEELEKLYKELQRRFDERNKIYEINQANPDYFKGDELIVENWRLMAKNSEDLDIMMILNRIIHNVETDELYSHHR